MRLPLGHALSTVHALAYLLPGSFTLWMVDDPQDVLFGFACPRRHGGGGGGGATHVDLGNYWFSKAAAIRAGRASHAGPSTSGSGRPAMNFGYMSRLTSAAARGVARS